MGLKVLHVDGDKLWRETVQETLKREGHTVVSVATLPQARVALEQDNFDVVICDGTVASRDDGYHWATELQNKDQRVIVFSGNSYQGIPHVKKTRHEDLASLLRDG